MINTMAMVTNWWPPCGDHYNRLQFHCRVPLTWRSIIHEDQHVLSRQLVKSILICSIFSALYKISMEKIEINIYIYIYMVTVSRCYYAVGGTKSWSCAQVLNGTAGSILFEHGHSDCSVGVRTGDGDLKSLMCYQDLRGYRATITTGVGWWGHLHEEMCTRRW